MNLIIIYPDEVGPDGSVVLTGDRARHIRVVLRAEPGKFLRVGLLNGPFGRGLVEKISASETVLRCEFEKTVPPRVPVTLLLAVPRPKVLKRLWAQLATLGVGRIILVNAEKVERYYFDSHVMEPAFYNARLVEGLQQARDTRLPVVDVVKELKPFMEDRFGAMVSSGPRLIADPSGRAGVLQRLRGVKLAAAEQISLAIGPEGGWTPYELDMFAAHGFEAVGMGPRILRTDTACIALVSLLAEVLRVDLDSAH